jgi:hypothetical protein
MSLSRKAARAMNDRPLHELRICILHVPDCPLVGRVRTDVETALVSVGASAVIEEVEGPYPSPTLLIDGIEVTGRALGTGPACRLDLPTTKQIVSAITAAGIEGTDPVSTPGGSA